MTPGKAHVCSEFQKVVSFKAFSKITRLLERFAPIFYLNCEHVFFVYILKQRKKFCGFLKRKFADFNEFNFFYKIKTFKTHFFKIFIINKLSLWSRGPTKKLGPIGSAVLAFIGHKQTDTQTDRQAKFIYRFW